MTTLGAQASGTPPLSAEIRIFESTTPHNSYPDDCDMRLDRLFIAEDLDLAIQVQFNRPLTDDEAQQVQWSVSDAATPSSGDFAEQPDPAVVTTHLVTDEHGNDVEATVHVTLNGTDIATPAPLRVISDAEYARAHTTLASYTAVGGRPRSQLPLTADLLSRFLGETADAMGSPSVSTYQLDICDPRLTHRAGANWGPNTVTDVPLVEYAADQPASIIVAEGAARALLADNEASIRQYFEDNPGAPSLSVNYPYTGNLTLNRPLDDLFALHGVNFDGTLSATVDAPTGRRGVLTAHAVQIQGSVTDLYDFALQAGGAGAFPAAEAAKLEIASVKYDDVGKVFVVSFALDSTFDALDV